MKKPCTFSVNITIQHYEPDCVGGKQFPLDIMCEQRWTNSDKNNHLLDCRIYRHRSYIRRNYISDIRVEVVWLIAYN